MKKQHSPIYQSKKAKTKKTGSKRNMAILASATAILILPALYFSHGTLGGFFIALAFEILALTVLVLSILYMFARLSGKSRGKVKEKPSRSIRYENIAAHTQAKSDKPRYQQIRKNFNWVVKDTGKSSTKTEVEPNIDKQEKQAAKFIPYRSPFEGINPPAKENDGDMLEAEVPSKAAVNNISGNILPDPACESDMSEYVSMEEPYELIDIVEDEIVDGSNLVTGIGEDGDFHEIQYPEISRYEFEIEDEVREEHEVKVLLEVEEKQEVESLFEISEEYEVDVSLQIEKESEVEELFNVEAEDEAAAALDAVAGSIQRNIDQIPKVVPFKTISAPKLVRPYVAPPVELLKAHEEPESERTIMSHTEYNANKLVETLASFGVGAKVINISEGPTVTRYELQPNVGVKVSKIVNLADDIALNLAAIGVRIEAPIPGKAAVGIEVPNREVTPVFLRDVVETPEFINHPSKLSFAVGKDIAGNTIVADIARMPHLLIAGATGSGKSVCINTLITSILYKAAPSEVKLLMVDPKVVELSIYNGIPHLLIPVVTDAKKAAGALTWAVVEMTSRYKLFAENNVRDLKGYNALLREKGESILPQIVIIIDELADLMMVAPNDVEDCICRLAQMARAAGMHLVIATQRPSVDVITGVIKANIPSRISFAVSSQIDSRTILDMAGAEKLLGRGDMLFSPIGEPKPKRVQGAFISDKEVEGIVSHIKSLYDTVEEYDEDIIRKIEKQIETPSVEGNGDDELLNQAVEIVIEQGQASTSLIQRKLKVGYSRAARILDQMEAWGIVGPPEGSKPRQIKITKQEWLELNS